MSIKAMFLPGFYLFLGAFIALTVSCGDDDDNDSGDSENNGDDDTDDDDSGDNGLYERCMTFYMDCMGYTEDQSVAYCEILPDVTDPCHIEAHNKYLDCMETNIVCDDFSAEESLACSEALQADIEACD